MMNSDRTLHLGIDPGADGAAILVQRAPDGWMIVGGIDTDDSTLAERIAYLARVAPRIQSVTLELVGPRPLYDHTGGKAQAVSSAQGLFRLGESIGEWRAVLTAVGLSWTETPPAVWQRAILPAVEQAADGERPSADARKRARKRAALDVARGACPVRPGGPASRWEDWRGKLRLMTLGEADGACVALYSGKIHVGELAVSARRQKSSSKVKK
jgi:hypothetical protein